MLMLYLSLIDDRDDQIKFEEIYTAYRKQMFLVANSILHNESDAEDVVHDVFVNIATKKMTFIRQIDNPEDLRNYLLKSAKNTALNETKKKDRNNVFLDTVSEFEIDDIGEISDDLFIETICNKSEYDKVVQAMLSMDEPYRDILYYHFVLELSVPDAAKHLNRNVATAKKQLVRGKKILLNLLGIKGDTDNGNE